jgi:ParB family chromosome partitioning protein
MAKVKPQRTGAVQSAIIEMAEKKEAILENAKDNIFLLKIEKIKELTLKDGTVMHNRLSCSKEKLNDLAENINKLHKEGAGLFGTGILAPILVRKVNGIYERVFGFSRISALEYNRQKEVPAIIVENMSDELARFIRSSENLNREDLNPYDETYSIMEHLLIVCDFNSIGEIKSFLNKVKNFKTGKIQKLSVEELNLLDEVEGVFNRIGRYEALSFADKMNILEIHPLIKEGIVDGYVSYTQAMVIKSKAKTENDISKILNLLRNKRMTVEELRKYFLELYVNVGDTNKDSNNLTRLHDNIKALSKIPKKNFKNISENDKKELEVYLEKINEILNKK